MILIEFLLAPTVPSEPSPQKSARTTSFGSVEKPKSLLKLAHRAYVMVNGKITMSGTGKELLTRPEVRAAYLEGGH